jgi:GT2 family glycosyltransferase
MSDSVSIAAAAPTTAAEVYVLLPVHNRRDVTMRMVACLQAQTFQDFRLVVIDDGSTDGTAAAIRRAIPDVVVVQGTGRLWWAGALQRGFDWLRRHDVAGDAIVLIMNDDVAVADDFVARGVALLRARTRTLLHAQYVAPNGSPVESGQSFDVEKLAFSVHDGRRPLNCLTTQALFMRWSDMRAIGGFHPRLLPHYLSDYEYTLRAHRLGFDLVTSPTLLLAPDRETTGFHHIDELSFSAFIGKFFSIKSPANPIYWSSFIVLACPPRLWVRHLFVLWKNSLHRLVIEFVRSLKHARADRTVRL